MNDHDEQLYAWEITHSGITAKVFARNRARARYLAAQALEEAGFAPSAGQAIIQLRCRRAPEYDVDALACGKEAIR